MERIAWILEDTCIYWNDVVRLLAVLAAVFCFLGLYLRKGKGAAALILLPLAGMASVVLGRAAHWYFRPEQYESLMAAVTDLGRGEFVLMGAVAGCFLAAVLVRMVGLTKDLPGLLDCMSLAGALGIGLGRLASLFDATDRGMVLAGNLPFAVATVNPVSGAAQWRLATFLLQAGAAGVIFLVLLLFYLTAERRQGDTTLLFLLFYGASQVVLDSTRYDGLMLRSNGFLSVVQLLSAAAVVLAVTVFAVRLVRTGGWKKWHCPLWLVQAGCLGLAGYMEYYVQRHGHRALFAYSVMAAAMAGLVLLTLLTRYLGLTEEKRHQAWLQELKEEL